MKKYHIVDPHDLVITNFTEFRVSREDELMASGNRPLWEVMIRDRA